MSSRNGRSLTISFDSETLWIIQEYERLAYSWRLPIVSAIRPALAMQLKDVNALRTEALKDRQDSLDKRYGYRYEPLESQLRMDKLEAENDELRAMLKEVLKKLGGE